MKCITNVDSGIEHKEELWLGEKERIAHFEQVEYSYEAQIDQKWWALYERIACLKAFPEEKIVQIMCTTKEGSVNLILKFQFHFQCKVYYLLI